MNPAFNPQPTFHSNPEQNDMFVFMTKHGFAAIALDLVQGFQTVSDQDSLAQFGTNVFVQGDSSYYTAVESVPELVARYAEMKKRRATATTLAGASSPGVTQIGSATGVWKDKKA